MGNKVGVKVGGRLADKEWLQAQYEGLRRSANNIAKELGCSRESVVYRLRSFGIPVRSLHNESKCRIDDGGRECTGCGVYKAWDAYWRSNTGHHIRGRVSRCIECQDPTAAQAAMRRYKLRRHHITEEQIAHLIELDGDVCALCGGDQQIEAADLDLDHDHECCPGPFSCGKCIRGRLCRSCNRLVGRIEAAGFTLDQLAVFLKRRPFAEEGSRS
jgi:recombination endonuclease VII